MLRILIAVDGSESSLHAIESVAKMARSSLDLEATLLCVSPEPNFCSHYTVATRRQIEADQLIEQNTILSDAMAHARTHDFLPGEPMRAYGVIADEIVRVARELQVDLITMGTRGTGAAGEMLLGSVAQRVLHQTSLPVMLVTSLGPKGPSFSRGS